MPTEHPEGKPDHSACHSSSRAIREVHPFDSPDQTLVFLDRRTLNYRDHAQEDGLGLLAGLNVIRSYPSTIEAPEQAPVGTARALSSLSMANHIETGIPDQITFSSVMPSMAFCACAAVEFSIRPSLSTLSAYSRYSYVPAGITPPLHGP
jgi:hypothetical protein